ncbi:MAG: HAD family hydrolase [Desulfosarcinaceae bacterium]|jgi:putative hydrolase of the HAD superfamily
MLLDTELRGLLAPRRPKPTAEKPRGGLRRPVAAVLFDIYGTLLISASGEIGPADAAVEAAPDADTSLDDWVRTLGYPPPAEGVRAALTAAIRAEHRTFKAKGIAFPEVIIEKIWGRLYPEANADQLRRLALAYELKVNPVWPMPGLRRCLAAFKKSGRRLGIVSNAQFYTPLLMTHFLGLSLEAAGFSPDLCVYSYQIGQAKPGARLFEAAKAGLARYNLAPQEAVMVGNDRRNDIAAARAAGFQTVLFAGDARSLRWRESDPDWKRAQPDMVITELTQLSDHMVSLNR